MLKVKHLDILIIFLLFASLPVDMINGILLKNNVVLFMSVSQFYKLTILLLFLFRFLFSIRNLVLFLFLSFMLLLPTFYQLSINFDLNLLFNDLIKTNRYLMPLVSFLFFVPIIKKGNQRTILKLKLLIRFSYVFLIANILLKLLGLGYPMYEEGNIGSKGFFFAGNEISALLIILASFVAYDYWQRKEKQKFVLFFILNIIIGLFISSKTGIIGILLVFFLIPVKRMSYKTSFKRLNNLLLSLFILLPFVLVISWFVIKTSSIYLRLQFFWDKLDIWTFILSNRNTFFEKSFEIYQKNYNLLEKLIGVGQTKYESLNGDHIVEMDIADIFFAYGILGLILFSFTIFFLFANSIKLAKNPVFIYAKYILLQLVVLFSVSTIAGHVFSSGMAAIFIGLTLSFMYLKQNGEISE